MASNNSLLDTIKGILVPIHKEGYPFIAAFAIVTFILALISDLLGMTGLILTLWCVYFFRDPVRTVPEQQGLLVSPADGLVQMIVEATPPAELEMGSTPLTRISIFLNVFNVHVNRIPVAGVISAMHYFPGKFLNASLDKASEENERQAVAVEMADGRKVGVIQIAGLVARRIVTHIKPDQHVATGERFGIIRFGSRVDIFLPSGVVPLVVEGQTAIGGETIIADLHTTEGRRTGVKI